MISASSGDSVPGLQLPGSDTHPVSQLAAHVGNATPSQCLFQMATRGQLRPHGRGCLESTRLPEPGVHPGLALSSASLTRELVSQGTPGVSTSRWYPGHLRQVRNKIGHGGGSGLVSVCGKQQESNLMLLTPIWSRRHHLWKSPRLLGAPCYPGAAGCVAVGVFPGCLGCGCVSGLCGYGHISGLSTRYC